MDGEARGRHRPNWHWRAQPVPPGPAVVFDIDGVLSDATSRQHFIERGRRDWHAFFEACGDDPVIEEVARLLELLDPSLTVVLLTGRPLRVLGRSSVKMIVLGRAMAPILLATCLRKASPCSGSAVWPVFNVT